MTFFLVPLPGILTIPIFLLALAAVLPAVYLLVQVYRSDRIEKEPVALILSLIGFGILAVFCSMVTESLGSRFADESTLWGRLLLYYIVVALSEEGFKYFFLTRKTWKNPNFNYRFDGIVYAVSVGAGFALFENLMYVFSFGFGTAVIRAVTAVPGHICFAVFMGTWYGQARQFAMLGEREASGRCRALALLIPVLLHGSYDFIATENTVPSVIVFILFVAIMFYISIRRVRVEAENDSYVG